MFHACRHLSLIMVNILSFFFFDENIQTSFILHSWWFLTVHIPPGSANQKGTVMGILRSLGALARALGPVVSSSGKDNRWQQPDICWQFYEALSSTNRLKKSLNECPYSKFSCNVIFCTINSGIGSGIFTDWCTVFVLFFLGKIVLCRELISTVVFLHSLLDSRISNLFSPHISLFRYPSGSPENSWEAQGWVRDTKTVNRHFYVLYFQ